MKQNSALGGVIHIKDIGPTSYEGLSEVHGEFSKDRPNYLFKNTMHGRTATYLFDDSADFRNFGLLLHRRNIKYSMHPAGDYEEIANQSDDPNIQRVLDVIGKFF